MSRTYQALKKAENERTSSRTPIVNIPVEPGDRPDVLWTPGAEAQLEYERMRVWITNPGSRGTRLQTVMLAGCHRGGGTTTTTALLAATLAQGKKFRVLVVDTNFRTPGLYRVFRTRSNGGLSDIVGTGSPAAESHFQPTAHENVFVVTTGAVPHCPADVVERVAADQFMAQLKAKFDFVLFDAAPLLEFPDSYALAPHVDGIILVVEADRTPIDDALKARRELERAGGHVLGVVLNRQRDYTPPFLKRFLRTAN